MNFKINKFVFLLLLISLFFTNSIAFAADDDDEKELSQNIDILETYYKNYNTF